MNTDAWAGLFDSTRFEECENVIFILFLPVELAVPDRVAFFI